jgi:predicted secreted Zn-dependent protease
VFEFRVIAGFRPRQSWVKAVVLNDTTQRRTVLGHEQTHFDLAEVHARIMRRAFGELAQPCAKTDAQLSALAQRLAQEERAEQRRYDAETNHGLLAGPQAAWTLQTRRRLAASN